MAPKCICEICICGRHRCPHRPTNVINKGDQPCSLSEYKNVYKEHPMAMRQPFKPSHEAMQQGNFDDKTTSRVDYIKHPLEKPFIHTHEQYKKPEGSMDNTTSYKKEYTEKYARPAQAIRHDGQRQVAGKFEGEPTYRHDFKQWDMSGRPGLVGASDQWSPPTAKFAGESTMMHDFQKHYQPRREMIRPDQAAKMSDAPFQDLTDYRQSYIKHPMEKKFAHEKEQYKKPSAPFEGSTTHKQDYRGQLGDRTVSFKPDAQAFNSGAPLESTTTNRNDFKRWQLEKPFVHAQEGYKKPEGQMESSTTHNATYREFPINKVLAKRPDSASKRTNAPFNGASSYTDDYKKWGLGGREKAVIRDEYQPNMAPFEGQSTQKAHFVPHPMNMVQSFRPDNNAFQSDAKFEDGTMYRTDYTPKRFDVCPAISLDNPSTSYRYIDTDNRGHRLYTAVRETITPLGQQRATPNKFAMSVA